MPICLFCRDSIPSLVAEEQQMTVAARCHRCNKVADKYIEQDSVTLWLDLMLLHGQAWTHCVFNTDRRTLRRTVLAVLLVTFLLDAYVVTVMNALVEREAEMAHIIQHGSDGEVSKVTNFTNLKGQLLEGLVRAATSKVSATGGGAVATPSGGGGTAAESENTPMSVVKSNGLPITQSGVVLSLRIVDVARSGILHLEPVLALTGYAAWEFALVGLCIVWATSAMGLGLKKTGGKDSTTSTPQGGKPADLAKADDKAKAKDDSQRPLRTAIRGMFLLAGPKLLYVLFLVWELPLYLLALVEITSILATFMCGRALLGPQTSISRPMFIALVSVGSRTIFRIVTQWAPPTVLMCGPAYISLLVET